MNLNVNISFITQMFVMKYMIFGITLTILHCLKFELDFSPAIRDFSFFFLKIGIMFRSHKFYKQLGPLSEKLDQ